MQKNFDLLMAEVDKLSAKECKASSNWIPEKVGDTLFGKLVKMDSVTSQYGPQLKLTIRTANGEERTRYCNKGEEKQIRKLGTKVGHNIVLKCKDIERLRNGKDSYVIAIASAPDMSNVAAVGVSSQQVLFDGASDDDVSF
jgi:hypothetical protein